MRPNGDIFADVFCSAQCAGHWNFDLDLNKPISSLYRNVGILTRHFLSSCAPPLTFSRFIVRVSIAQAKRLIRTSIRFRHGRSFTTCKFSRPFPLFLFRSFHREIFRLVRFPRVKLKKENILIFRRRRRPINHFSFISIIRKTLFRRPFVENRRFPCLFWKVITSKEIASFIGIYEVADAGKKFR